MSEFVLDEDPEPPSRGFYEFIRTSIIEPSRYVDDGLATEYRREQERVDIPVLSRFADTLLRVSDPTINAHDDQMIFHQNATLRRHVEDIWSQGGRIGVRKHYYFNAVIDEQEYCRAWTDSSSLVNWCYNEQRHEPAADVLKNLETAFLTLMLDTPGQLGKLTLSRLIRQKV